MTRPPTRAPRAAPLGPARSARSRQPGQGCSKGCAWERWSRTGRLAAACVEPGLGHSAKRYCHCDHPLMRCSECQWQCSVLPGQSFASRTKPRVGLQAPALPHSAPDNRPRRLQAISVRPGGAAALLTPADGVVAALAACVSQSAAAPGGSAGLLPRTCLSGQPAMCKASPQLTALPWQMSAMPCLPSGV